MKMKLGFLILATAIINVGFGQIYKTKTGVIKFFSKTTAENIDATNKQISAAINSATGAVEYSAIINSFIFKKDLMQKHFQENYMESSKFPTAKFAGKIVDNTKVNYTKDGTYTVSVKGKMTMHGVTKEITVPGTVVVAGGKVTMKCNFKVKLADYNIKVPTANANQIAKEIDVTVDCTCSK